MSIKDILVLPIRGIQVSILESKRREAAEKITKAKNTGEPADVVIAKEKYSQVQNAYDRAAGLKPDITQ